MHMYVISQVILQSVQAWKMGGGYKTTLPNSIIFQVFQIQGISKKHFKNIPKRKTNS